MERTEFFGNVGNRLSSDAASRTGVTGSAAHRRGNMKQAKQHFLNFKTFQVTFASDIFLSSNSMEIVRDFSLVYGSIAELLDLDVCEIWYGDISHNVKVCL
jgi:hypothetical protein